MHPYTVVLFTLVLGAGAVYAVPPLITRYVLPNVRSDKVHDVLLFLVFSVGMGLMVKAVQAV